MTFLRLGEGFNTLPNMACAGDTLCCEVWMREREGRCAAKLRTVFQELYAFNKKKRESKTPSPEIGKINFLIFYFLGQFK